MNPMEIRSARRGRLGYQSQILWAVDDEGFQIYDDDAQHVLDPDRAPWVLQAVGVPPKLAGATLATSLFGLVDEVRDWYVDVLDGASDQHLVALVGDGSNHTAAALLRNAVKWGKTVAWYTWHDFASRYTDNITLGRLLDSSASPEEQAEAASAVYEAEREDDRLRHVYEVVALVDFDIDDVRDFAVPAIVSMFKNRADFGLTTILTVGKEHAGPLVSEKEQRRYGGRAPLLRLFNIDGVVFDAS